MNSRTLLSLTLGLGVGLILTLSEPAAADGPPKNLKVLKSDTNGKVLEKAMKELSKGLGVKCGSCHVKGKFDSDEVKAKEASRKFLTAVLGETDAEKRKKALAELLPALELKEAKNADLIWKSLEPLQKAK